MSTPCEVVAERVALGEELGDVAEHAASCARCRVLVALPTELGATHREVDPGLGFASRMTAGAQQRIAVRKRRRMASGLAAAVAFTALGVFAVTHEPTQQQTVAESPRKDDNPAVQPNPEQADEADEEEIRALLQMADTDRSSKLSANWAEIQKPLRPYRAVLQGVRYE